MDMDLKSRNVQQDFVFLPVKIIKVVGLLMKQFKIKGTDSPVAAFLC